MNFYMLFYWITVAERVQTAVFTIAVLSTILAIGSFIFYLISKGSYIDNTRSTSQKVYTETNKIEYTYNDTRNEACIKWASKLLKTFVSLGSIMWVLYIAVPSKADTILIIAGGAVGNFVTRDSATKQIPSEVMNFLREKIKYEVNELHMQGLSDSLQGKTKEELIELIKQKH